MALIADGRQKRGFAGLRALSSSARPVGAQTKLPFKGNLVSLGRIKPFALTRSGSSGSPVFIPT
jgi:hypothetical protein